MDRFGNLNSVSGDGVMNTAGWRRGLGYCDAQCPKDPRFVQGAGYNKDHVLASCCPEMEPDCGAACDRAGADINTFRESGPGHALYDMLDVSAPFKINTSFITDNGHPNGTLDIVQIFSQNGEQKGRLSFADRFKAAKSEGFRPEDEFATVYGGLAQMGEAIRGNMNWSLDCRLDSCHTNKTIYQCSEHEKFDESVWAQASAVKPGIWRGPADHFPDYDTSYKTKDVFFNYDGIPALIRSQVRFGCRGCETASSICDCSGVPYKFTVSNIEDRHPFRDCCCWGSQAKHRLIPDQPEPTEAPNDNQNSRPNLIWTILLPTVGAVVVAACCAFLCCYACNEDSSRCSRMSFLVHRKAAVKAKRSLAPANQVAKATASETAGCEFGWNEGFHGEPYLRLWIAGAVWVTKSSSVGADPSTYEMMQKVKTLQKRLISKTEEAVEKDLAIQEKEKLYLEMRNLLDKQPSSEVVEEVGKQQNNLKEKTKQMKAMAAELNMYHAQLSDYKEEIERVTKELQDTKRRYFEQRHREQLLKDQKVRGADPTPPVLTSSSRSSLGDEVRSCPLPGIRGARRAAG
eukprot:s267_g10.t1